jgi:hypothetical protein
MTARRAGGSGNSRNPHSPQAGSSPASGALRDGGEEDRSRTVPPGRAEAALSVRQPVRDLPSGTAHNVTAIVGIPLNLGAFRTLSRCPQGLALGSGGRSSEFHAQAFPGEHGEGRRPDRRAGLGGHL